METPAIIDRTNYSQQVFNYLFGEISCHRLKSGDKLPNERTLSEMLGISRPPLREALKSLSTIGLLTTRHGGGTYVNDYGPEYINSILRFLTVCNSNLMIDFIQLRRAIESECVFMAAKNATDEDIKTLESLCDRREKIEEANREDYSRVREELHQLDYEFHTKLAEASQNRIFSEFLQAISNTLATQQNYASRVINMPREANDFHRSIVEAIKKKDGAEAQRLMHAHLDKVEEAIRLYSEEEKQ